jgi:hypothetical protein
MKIKQNIIAGHFNSDVILSALMEMKCRR